MTTNIGKEAAVSKTSNESQMTNDRVAKNDGHTQVVSVRPVADILETKEGATIYVDLPGVSHDSLDINVDSDVLIIEGTVNLQTPESLNPTYMDVRAGKFSRKFTLSAELDSSKIDANLKNGVLKLTIPRSEKHKPRKIEVKAA